MLLLEEALLVLLALVVAVDDLQQKAGQGDQLAVRGGEHALEQGVAGLVEQDQDGQRVLHLRQKKIKSIQVEGGTRCGSHTQ